MEEDIEEEKFNEIYVQVRAGGLADFFQAEDGIRDNER